MDQRNIKFGIIVGKNAGGIFLDMLIKFKLKPEIVVTENPNYISKQTFRYNIITRYVGYLLKKRTREEQYYTYYESLRNNIKVFPSQIVNSKKCSKVLKSLSLDYIFIFTSQMIKDFIFTIPQNGTINFHPSVLPMHRGAHPEFWTIKMNDNFSGFTIHYIDKGIDTGEIILQHKIEINNLDDSLTLSNHIFNIGSREFVKLIYKLAIGMHIESFIEKGIKPSYQKPVSIVDKTLKIKMNSKEIINTIQSCRKYGYATLTIDNRDIKVQDAFVLSSLPENIVIHELTHTDCFGNIYLKTIDRQIIYLITQ